MVVSRKTATPNRGSSGDGRWSTVEVEKAEEGRSNGSTVPALSSTVGSTAGKSFVGVASNKKEIRMFRNIAVGFFLGTMVWAFVTSMMGSTNDAVGLFGVSSVFSSESAAKEKSAAIKRLKRRKYDVCIVGAGLSGSVLAERYASTKEAKSILMVEKRPHFGGNCYDYVDQETNIRVSKYGAHLFHTNVPRVWDYISQFGKWVKYEHEVLAVLPKVSKQHFPVPVNINTVNILFGLNITSVDEMNQWLKQEQMKYLDGPKNSEEMALSRVGPRLYELIFRPYTKKQWDKEPKELGPEVTARIPVRNNFDGRYFGDPLQFLPKHGYTAIFEAMYKPHLKSGVLELHLNMDYFHIRDHISCQSTYFTGPIDVYFAHAGYPKLEYRSLSFERQVHKGLGKNKYFQPAFVVNHPSADTDFTRIVEYKHLERLIGEKEKDARRSQDSVIFLERSSDVGEPYYPVPNDENKALFRKYQLMAEQEKGVHFVGRLANYKYFNMDQAIHNALDIFDQHIKNKKTDQNK